MHIKTACRIDEASVITPYFRICLTEIDVEAFRGIWIYNYHVFILFLFYLFFHNLEPK